MYRYRSNTPHRRPSHYRKCKPEGVDRSGRTDSNSMECDPCISGRLVVASLSPITDRQTIGVYNPFRGICEWKRDAVPGSQALRQLAYWSSSRLKLRNQRVTLSTRQHCNRSLHLSPNQPGIRTSVTCTRYSRKDRTCSRSRRLPRSQATLYWDELLHGTLASSATEWCDPNPL
jgi:hypothetical protein